LLVIKDDESFKLLTNETAAVNDDKKACNIPKRSSLKCWDTVVFVTD